MADLKDFKQRDMKEVVPSNIWQPATIGEGVEGVLVAIEQKIGKFGSNLYTIEQAKGVRVGVWGSATLQPRMERVKVGQFVQIKYQGEFATKNGTAKKFQVFAEQTE